MASPSTPFETLTALVAAVIVCLALIGVSPVARAEDPAFVANPVEHVDTLIGTGTGGETVGEINNFPGPAAPFGMVQYSPDTTDTYAGYDHDNDRSTGFSLNHASVGCAAFGDIPVLPTTTPIGSHPWDAWETIAHDDTEAGMPGYYTVRFPDTGVSAELTATTRTGVGRFRYPADGRPALFHVRTDGSLAGNSEASIQIGPDNTTVTGSATTGGFCGAKNKYTVYFAMKFGQPFTSYGSWDGDGVHPGARSAEGERSGGYLEFPIRLGVRGADRAVLCQRRRGASQPCGRACSQLRRGPGRNGQRLERATVTHPGGRNQQRRLAYLLYRACIGRFCIPTLSTTLTDVISDSTVSSVACPRGTPSTPTSPTGIPIAAWPPCRRCCFRSGPATWPNRW